MSEFRNEQERSQFQKLVDEAADALREQGLGHVIVLASWETENGETGMVEGSHGNWYAQYGMLSTAIGARDTRHRVDGPIDDGN